MKKAQMILGAGLALAGSGILHAAVLVAVLPQATEDHVDLPAAGQGEVAALGASFADFAAGAMPVTASAQTAIAAPPQITAPVSQSADLPVTPEVATAAPPDAVTPAAPTMADAAPRLRPTPRPDRPAPAPQRAGNAAEDAQRGSAMGQDSGQSASAGTQSAAPAVGNDPAAVAAYPGLILRQITRQRRQATNARGSAMVQFIVGGNGELAGLGLLQSSGSDRLDQMALDHIRRAAPFPPPPPGAETRFSFEFVGRS
jgi:protein TonB